MKSVMRNGGAREESPISRPHAWSESFQDLGSWCLPHRDELNAPSLFTNQNELTFSFDDQSKCDKWDVSSSPSPLEFQSDMWGHSNGISLSPFMLSDDENYLMLKPVGSIDSHLPLSQHQIEMTPEFKDDEYGARGKGFEKAEEEDEECEKESPIRYSGNLVLTQCTYGLISDKEDLPRSKGKQISATLQDQTNDTVKLESMDNLFKIPFSGTSVVAGGASLSNQSQPLTSSTNLMGITSKSSVQTNVTGSSLKKERPKLSLNVSKANNAAPQSPGDVDLAFKKVDTPDVIKLTATNQDGFNIISYIEGDYGTPLPGNCIGAVGCKTPLAEVQRNVQVVSDDIGFGSFSMEDGTFVGKLCSNSQQADPEDIKSDHDYTEAKPFQVKEEPPSPKCSTSSHEQQEYFSKLNAKSLNRFVGKRVRKSTASDDYDFDTGGASDTSSDWSPQDEKRSRTKRKSNKPRPSQSKRARKSSESDNCSIVSAGQDKYRELRDRNNEASRRSRMNRKQKESEMIDMALAMENNNTLLKRKAAYLEKRVITLREVLMKLVLEGNSKTRNVTLPSSHA